MCTEEQKEIIELPFEGNYIVRACAGSGKTTTMIKRVKENLKYLEKRGSIKTVLIISFTNASKEDIIEKTEGDLNMSITTFHGFILNEVIKFYEGCDLRDKNFSWNYKNKNNDYSSWRNNLVATGEIGVSKDTKEDFLFRFGKEILSENKFAIRYLKNKFHYIYIDEGQDNNSLQYDIIEILLDVGINFFLVGDENQAIYEWRGADWKKFEKFSNSPLFTNKNLTKNFRCHKIINKYANAGQLPPNNESANGDGIFFYDSDSDLKEPIKNKNVFFLRKQNDNCKEISKKFNIPHIIKPQFLVSLSNNHFLERILREFFNSQNVYSVINNLPEEYNLLIEDIEIFFTNQKVETFKGICEKFILVTGTELIEVDSIQSIFDKIVEEETKQYYIFDSSKSSAVATIHSSKGLEFDTVIIYEKDFGYWNGNIEEKLLYVAMTRAKKQLFVIKSDNNHKIERLTIN